MLGPFALEKFRCRFKSLMKKLLLSLMGCALSLTALAETIKITYPNWADGVAVTHLAAAVLEDHMGYQVELKEADVATIYRSVAEGEQDVFLDAWLPFTQSEYWKKHSSRLEPLGTMLQRTRVGLAVPTYVDVESLRELNTISGKVGGKIYGIEKTAGLTNSTNIAIREYDLKFKQTNRDTAYMLNALEKAIEAEEPIVVAAWSPHWMFARYDLRMLHDPVNVFVEDGIRKCARKGFAAEQPEAALFLKRFALNEGQLNALLLEIYESDTDPRDVARKWIAKNPEIVEAWTAPEKKKGFFKRLFN